MSCGAISTQAIDSAVGIEPVGVKNGVNLIFRAPEKFIPDSLQVSLSGLVLTKGKDLTIQSDNETFIIILNPDDPDRLNVPPLQNEDFSLNYVRF